MVCLLAVENSLSEGVLVAGMHNNFFAMLGIDDCAPVILAMATYHNQVGGPSQKDSWGA